MMQNYLKSEWYRITRSHELYLLTGFACAIAIAANLVMYAMKMTEVDFPYATIHFSLSNLIATLPLIFIGAGVIVALLFADDKKNGTLKNAIANGVSRTQAFIGKCLICTVSGILSLVVIIAVYIGAAMLLLDGSAVEPVQKLLEGIGATIPSAIAMLVLAVVGFTVFTNTTTAMIFWAVVAFAIPSILSLIGLQVEPVAAVASWCPTNFLSGEVIVNRTGFDCLWNTPYGLMKCLVAGGAGIVIFSAFGLWRARSMDI